MLARPANHPAAQPALPPGIIAVSHPSTTRAPHPAPPAGNNPGFKAEVEAAARFVVDLVDRAVNPRRQAPSTPSRAASSSSSSVRPAAGLTEAELAALRVGLASALSDRLAGHWYPSQPALGSGYRSLSFANGRVDRAFATAIDRAGLARARRRAHTVAVCAMRAISAKADIRVFVDPGCVSVRRADSPPFYVLGGPMRHPSRQRAAAALAALADVGVVATSSTTPARSAASAASAPARPPSPPSPRSLSPSARVFSPPPSVAGIAGTAAGLVSQVLPRLPKGSLEAVAVAAVTVTASPTSPADVSSLPATLPPLRYLSPLRPRSSQSRPVSGAPAVSAIRAGMQLASSWTFAGAIPMPAVGGLSL